MIIENLTTLEVNKLSQEQYEREFAAGNLVEGAWYLIPVTKNSGSIDVDLVYNPTSTNAQSGIAVAQAIEQALGEISSALEELHSYATSLAGGGSQ